MRVVSSVPFEGFWRRIHVGKWSMIVRGDILKAGPDGTFACWSESYIGKRPFISEEAAFV